MIPIFTRQPYPEGDARPTPDTTLTLTLSGASGRQQFHDNVDVASVLADRELPPAPVAKPFPVRVTPKESSITAAIARIASGRRAA